MEKLYYAYARGYWLGYEVGDGAMPGWLKDRPDDERLAWKQGYDRGVADYAKEQDL